MRDPGSALPKTGLREPITWFAHSPFYIDFFDFLCYNIYRKNIESDYMALVNCKYCKKQFDRDKEPFIQIPWGQKAFRYAHAQCYIDEFNSGKEKKVYKIWNPKTSTTCFWCNKALDKTEDTTIPMPELPNRWVHKACAEKHPENDFEKLMIYIIQLYKLKDNYIPQKYRKQLNQYEQEYEFTYSGMLKALKYWYEIKHHPLDTTRGVGIIPYIYKEAREYYYALYIAQLQNESITDYEEYKPKDIVVKIKPPQRQIEKRQLFTFLDEDNINE